MFSGCVQYKHGKKCFRYLYVNLIENGRIDDEISIVIEAEMIGGALRSVLKNKIGLYKQ